MNDQPLEVRHFKSIYPPKLNLAIKNYSITLKSSVLYQLLRILSHASTSTMSHEVLDIIPLPRWLSRRGGLQSS
jgi:hypothetical protein